MTPSTNPRKRLALSPSVQPSITSFFSSSPSNDGPPNSSTTATASNPVTWHAISTPNELPPSIKSGLLNVGMRVRKAVPEGLKTGTYKSTKFALTVSTQKNVPPQPKGHSKREHQEDQQIEPPIGVDRPAGQIAVPKSLKRRHHAAVPRGVAVVDRCGGDEEFEEAGFLQPIKE